MEAREGDDNDALFAVEQLAAAKRVLQKEELAEKLKVELAEKLRVAIDIAQEEIARRYCGTTAITAEKQLQLIAAFVPAILAKMK